MASAVPPNASSSGAPAGAPRIGDEPTPRAAAAASDRRALPVVDGSGVHEVVVQPRPEPRPKPKRAETFRENLHGLAGMLAMHEALPKCSLGNDTSAGTPLASASTPMPASATSHEAQLEIWRGQRTQYFSEMSPADHVWFVVSGLVTQLFSLGIFLHAGYPTCRLVGLGAAFLLFTVGRHVVMMWSLRTCPRSRCQATWKSPFYSDKNLARRMDPSRIEIGFAIINVMAQLYSISAAVLTGGFSSPAVPMLLVPAFISLLFLGPRPMARRMSLLNITLIASMLALPDWMSGPKLPTLHYGAALVVSLAWTLLILHHIYGHIATISHRAGDAIGCMREQRLAEAEAQTRRLQAVGAKVAHELKNPLAAIKGLCQLIARNPASDRTAARLAVVDAEIARMETILAEYLSFSRPLEDVCIAEVDLAAISKDVVDVLTGRAAQTGVELSASPEAVPFHGDGRRLREALLNLVANAIEATPSGGSVRITCSAEGQGARIAVRDSGRGIPQEHLARLGTSFFTTRSEGTGLGVVLAQGVVQQHGGQLVYSSEAGRGTTATIVLPERLPLGSAGVAPAPAAA